MGWGAVGGDPDYPWAHAILALALYRHSPNGSGVGGDAAGRGRVRG